MSSRIRAFSTTTSQTAPVLQGSQQEFSPLKTLDLPVYTRNSGNGEIFGGTSTAPRQRIPEQCHSRERASYGGSSSGAGVDLFSGASSFNPLAPSEEAFRSPIPSDVMKCNCAFVSDTMQDVGSEIGGHFLVLVIGGGYGNCESGILISPGQREINDIYRLGAIGSVAFTNRTGGEIGR
ncbi:unnamed protein product [Hymenolepis diminuta]|uniref:Copine domain-containing protein n=1 Tax=Hymenolepis diminuta TaxID=6216 RepID=A0A0R3SYS8_HYMDI|nr:unnamed protein product [Hymenolepis diminuta]